MRKRTIFIIVGIVIYLIVGIIVNVCFIIPRINRLDNSDWYMDEVDDITHEYAKQLNPDGKQVWVRNYYFVDYDKDIAKSNESAENKEYPFLGVDADVKIGSKYYIFHIVKDSFGQLYVESHEFN